MPSKELEEINKFVMDIIEKVSANPKTDLKNQIFEIDRIFEGIYMKKRERRIVEEVEKIMGIFRHMIQSEMNESES